jgi:hypothetical protein
MNRIIVFPNPFLLILNAQLEKFSSTKSVLNVPILTVRFVLKLMSPNVNNVPKAPSFTMVTVSTLVLVECITTQKSSNAKTVLVSVLSVLLLTTVASVSPISTSKDLLKFATPVVNPT